MPFFVHWPVEIDFHSPFCVYFFSSHLLLEEAVPPPTHVYLPPVDEDLVSEKNPTHLTLPLLTSLRAAQTAFALEEESQRATDLNKEPSTTFFQVFLSK